MTQQYQIQKRENPFQFHASEFLGDVPTLEHLYELDAKTGALAYVINTGYTYIQARPGDWKQLKAGKGTSGPRGPQGERGPIGFPGRDGKNGLQGSTGPAGPTGPQGPKGRDGEDGRNGAPGRDGADGVDGKDGKDGIIGRDGVDGKQGPVGPRGLTGTNGEDGCGWTRGEYNYETGVVTFHSDDGIGFSTGDLRGAPSPWAHMSLEQLANALKPYLQ